MDFLKSITNSWKSIGVFIAFLGGIEYFRSMKRRNPPPIGPPAKKRRLQELERQPLIEQENAIMVKGNSSSLKHQLRQYTSAIGRGLASLGFNGDGVESIYRFGADLIDENERAADAVTAETVHESRRISEKLREFPELFERFHRTRSEFTKKLECKSDSLYPSLAELQTAEANFAASVTDSLHALKKFARELDLQLASCLLANTDHLKIHVRTHLDGCARIEEQLQAIKKQLQAGVDTSLYLGEFSRACKELNDLRADFLGEVTEEVEEPREPRAGRGEQLNPALMIEETS